MKQEMTCERIHFVYKKSTERFDKLLDFRIKAEKELVDLHAL